MIQIDKPMPEGCDVCPLMYDYIQCNALPEGCKDDDDFNKDEFDWTKRPNWCPLKEQEAVNPKKIKGFNQPCYVHYDYVCENCNTDLIYKQPYCAGCGRSVKWE